MSDQWYERRVGGGVPKGLLKRRAIRDAGSAKATVSRVGVSRAADWDAEESRMQEELVMLEPAGVPGRCAEDQLK